MEKRKILPGMSHQLSYPNCLEYGSDIWTSTSVLWKSGLSYK
jgi:hypothetical protein